MKIIAYSGPANDKRVFVLLSLISLPWLHILFNFKTFLWDYRDNIFHWIECSKQFWIPAHSQLLSYQWQGSSVREPWTCVWQVCFCCFLIEEAGFGWAPCGLVWPGIYVPVNCCFCRPKGKFDRPKSNFRQSFTAFICVHEATAFDRHLCTQTTHRKIERHTHTHTHRGKYW